MGFAFQGLSSNVTVSGTLAVGLPTPATGQSVVNATLTSNNTVQTIYTVTAGKSFALYGASSEPGASTFYVYKPDGTTVLCSQSVGNIITSTTPIWIFAAGEAVKCKCVNGIFNVWGVEY